MAAPNSNGGIYIHTKYQADDWPRTGFETQVNNTHKDWKKTGSIYDVANVSYAAAEDNKWWTQHIIVEGNSKIKLDDINEVSVQVVNLVVGHRNAMKGGQG